MEGKANGIANWLSKHPLMQLPKEVPTSLKIYLEIRAMDAARNAHLNLVEGFLRTDKLPVGLGVDDCVAVKRSSQQFVNQGGQFCKQLAYRLVFMVGISERSELLIQTHTNYSHCGAQKLLQALLRSAWWHAISDACQQHVCTCVLC